MSICFSECAMVTCYRGASIAQLPFPLCYEKSAPSSSLKQKSMTTAWALGVWCSTLHIWYFSLCFWAEGECTSTLCHYRVHWCPGGAIIPELILCARSVMQVMCWAGVCLVLFYKDIDDVNVFVSVWGHWGRGCRGWIGKGMPAIGWLIY